MPSPVSDDSRRQLAALLRQRHVELVERWKQRVLEDPAVPDANRLSEPELRDHIPKLIDALSRDLDTPGADEAAGRAIGSGTIARAHARHRAANGYSLTEALRELSHFRAAILDLCIAAGVTLDDGAAKLLHAAIDESMVTGGDEMERASLDTHRQQAAFRERFIGILGHDLRTPIQVIQLGAATLFDPGEASPDQATIVERMASCAGRMERMIGDLLDLTRARFGGDMPIAPAPFDLGEIAGDVLAELKIAYPKRAVLRTLEGNLRGEWDRDRLAQLLANLIGNALEYSPADTEVRVDLRGAGASVVVSVNNQGTTIAPEVLPHLFDPFVRGTGNDRTRREREGLGLGLFIAKQVVETHGGSIDVTSTPEGGTTFTVHLPRAVPPAEAPSKGRAGI